MNVQATTAAGGAASSAAPAVDPRAKATALQFEQMLVQELSQSLVQGSGLEGGSGEEGEGGGGADPVLSSLVPQALGEAVTRGGGLGLADTLARSLGADTAPVAPPPASSPAGGTAA